MHLIDFVISRRNLGLAIVAIAVVSGCGPVAESPALTLDGAPITTLDVPVEVTSSTSEVPAPFAPTSPSIVSLTTTLPPTSVVTTVPITTVPAPMPTETSPWPRAIDVLATIVVAREQGDGYDRDLFEHWITRGGCSTREDVLIRDSFTPAQVDPFGCRVVAGDWVSPYDGATWDTPSDVDIDHVVALKEAWDSGAWAWSASRRRAFANDLADPRTLRAVTDEVNQSKGDKDPSNWLPPLQSSWCSYLADWVAIKARWQLTMDDSEVGRIRNLLNRNCADVRVAPWPSTP